MADRFFVMRTVWLAGLLLFCAVASGFILVRGRGDDGGPGRFAAGLADQAGALVEDAARRRADATPAAERAPATFYRYTDESGAVRFVSSLSQVPKARRGSARPVSNERVQRAAAAVPVAPREPETRDAPDAPALSAAHEVIVYGTSSDGWSRKAMTFLENEGVAFESRDIRADDAWRGELVEKTGDTRIPVVEIDGRIIRGYDPQRMAKLLRSP
jgi:glutaredoxin